jgi:hypothetical protein
VALYESESRKQNTDQPDMPSITLIGKVFLNVFRIIFLDGRYSMNLGRTVFYTFVKW